ERTAESGRRVMFKLKGSMFNDPDPSRPSRATANHETRHENKKILEKFTDNKMLWLVDPPTTRCMNLTS
ncbi:MAG TPA: hypothetical protein VMM56_10210, partial [Planctomycetaceae bacterium]|nr:hypothetical protein [Planctomycetaceae bacterium]